MYLIQVYDSEGLPAGLYYCTAQITDDEIERIIKRSIDPSGKVLDESFLSRYGIFRQFIDQEINL